MHESILKMREIRPRCAIFAQLRKIWQHCSETTSPALHWCCQKQSFKSANSCIPLASYSECQLEQALHVCAIEQSNFFRKKILFDTTPSYFVFVCMVGRATSCLSWSPNFARKRYRKLKHSPNYAAFEAFFSLMDVFRQRSQYDSNLPLFDK